MLSESDAAGYSPLDTFCEFIETVIHNILYIRKQYPETVFEAKRKYRAVLYYTFFPDVNDYIVNCVKAVRYHLSQSQLKAIFLCFDTPGLTERYVFKNIQLNSSLDSDPFLVRLEQHLHDFCLKLHSVQNKVDPVPEESVFSVKLQVTEASAVEFSQGSKQQDFPWIHLSEIEDRDLKIIPLQRLQTDLLAVDMYYERLTVFA